MAQARLTLARSKMWRGEAAPLSRAPGRMHAKSARLALRGDYGNAVGGSAGVQNRQLVVHDAPIDSDQGESLGKGLRDQHAVVSMRRAPVKARGGAIDQRAYRIIVKMVKLGATMAKPKKRWSLAEAKSRLSEVIREAERRGPQTVTRHGRTAAIIIAAEDWRRRRKRKGTFIDFMNASPLRGSGIKIERIKDRPRDLDL